MATGITTGELARKNAKKRITKKMWDDFLGLLVEGMSVPKAQKKLGMHITSYRVLMLTDDEKREQKDAARLDYIRHAWSDEVMDNILNDIAGGMTNKEAVKVGAPIECKSDEVAMMQFYTLIREDVVMKDRYDHAREVQMHGYADDIVNISDDATNDTILGPKGTQISNPSAVRRAEVRMKSRMWLAERVSWRQFGNRQQMDVKVQTIDHADALNTARGRNTGAAEKHRQRLKDKNVVSDQ